MNNNTCNVIGLPSCTIQLETVEHCTYISSIQGYSYVLTRRQKVIISYTEQSFHYLCFTQIHKIHHEIVHIGVSLLSSS